MYLKSGLGFIRYSYKDLLNVCRHLSDNCLGRIKIMIDALYCLFYYGCIFTEYEAFEFHKRTSNNRKTFVTVIWLLKVLEKYNPIKFRHNFHDKILFNTLFKDYIGRKWLPISESNVQVIESFVSTNRRLVLKNSNGCSGKQVHITSGQESVESIIKLINSGEFNLIEEVVENCQQIKELNPTSLNTIRIVTVHGNGYFTLISAALRIGGIGQKVDNVSQGGAAARININTGKVDTLFCTNAYRENVNSLKGKNIIGFEIPFWEETISMLESASKLVPEIHIVGWDIAITDNGPVLIEGNESFHTDIMQFYADTSSPGLKDEFIDALQHISV